MLPMIVQNGSQNTATNKSQTHTGIQYMYKFSTVQKQRNNNSNFSTNNRYDEYHQKPSMIDLDDDES